MNDEQQSQLIEAIINNEAETETQAAVNHYYQAKKKSPGKILIPVLLTISILLLIISVALAVFLKKQTDKTNEYKLQTETLTATLKLTEDGKQILEDANKELDKKATDAQKDATDAKQEATSANEKLTKAQAELNAKLAEVNKVNTELKTKQADLDKANRGISKFAELKTLFAKYDNDSALFMTLINDCYVAILDGDEATYNSKFSQLQPVADRLESESESISALFDTIEKGTY